ncbi:hypothetical protein CWR48_13560 [Oceanobacillus arenosus]|uniref:Uncharacterized protein n=1 Tax=Oceanobacillus arenosus TaxID=1229153 RepID=A0A3D8PN56_9BACI|nr:hypothetical protein CWR48_13560 [Oceanobacillus arenosus]
MVITFLFDRTKYIATKIYDRFNFPGLLQSILKVVPSKNKISSVEPNLHQVDEGNLHLITILRDRKIILFRMGLLLGLFIIVKYST